MKYLLEGHTLTIEDFNISDAMELISILQNNRIINVIPKSNLSKPCLLLIKKYTKTDTIGWTQEMAQSFNKLECKVPIRPRVKESYWIEWFFRVVYVFNFRANNKLQDKFWIETFNAVNTTILVENIFIVLLLFFCIGIAISFLLYHEFIGFGIQLESARVSIYSGIKILCPMFTSFVIMAKSCTALSAIILTMYKNGDPRIMQLMGLPFNRVYLNPLFFSILISGPIMNLFAVAGLLAGCVTTWVINGNSPDLFLSILLNELSVEYLVDSIVRAGLASLICGIATCIGGTARYTSNGIVTSVNSCVVVAAIGNVVVQAIVSILTTVN